MSEFNKEVFLQNLKEVNTVLKQIHICIDNIVKLSNDMAGADSEINEAILQLQQNVITINGTLTEHTSSISSLNNNVSTLNTTTNTLNLNKMDAPNITITGNSGTFTQEVFNKLSLDRNMYIVRNTDDGTQWFVRKLTYYDDLTNNLCYLYENISKYNINQDNCNIAKEQIIVDCVSKEWTYSSTQQIVLYNKSQVDALLENAGGGLDLLWETTASTSAVESLNVLFDYTQYKGIIIEMRVGSGNTTLDQKKISQIILFNKGTETSSIFNTILSYTDTNGILWTRDCNLYDGGFHISNGIKYAISTGTKTTFQSTCLIPQVVYGIK